MTQFIPRTAEELVAECRACAGEGHIDGEKCGVCDGKGYVPYLEPRSIFRMTPEQRAEIMAKNPPEITDVFHANAYVAWTWMGCGFGQLSFSVDPKTGEITCSDEHMGRDRVRTILHALADHIADKAVLDD